MKNALEEYPMSPSFVPLLRRMLVAVLIGSMVLTGTMRSRWTASGGTGTAAVLGLAD